MSQKSFLDNKKSRKNFPYVGRGGGGSTNIWKIPYVSSFLFLKAFLTLGWKNEKRPSGPIELDLEAGNLVLFCVYSAEAVPMF